jgi:hypothetical protein
VELADYALCPDQLEQLRDMYSRNSRQKRPEISITEQQSGGYVQYTERVTETGFTTIRRVIADRYLLNVLGNNKTSMALLSGIADNVKP